MQLAAKGDVLDRWYAEEFRGQPFRHILGFAAEEARRALRDQDYATANRRPEYPLITDWAWDRDDCDAYLRAQFGQRWSRSACGYCPFAASRRGLPELVERWRAEPEVGALALALEHTALALNPRSRLFGKLSARQVVLDHGLADVQRRFEQRLEDPGQEWTLYDVRRIIHPRRDDPTGRELPGDPSASTTPAAARKWRPRSTGWPQGRRTGPWTSTGSHGPR
ncbi:hypothetical protein GXW82_23400 [Streptacidiphilus sp. 4-A2]|nr:hypothetical protein [Streptacidiphilus sp. 4-A2]